MDNGHFKRGGGHYTIYKAGTDTNKGEGDKHYKKGGDGQYTGRKHMKNVSIPLFIYLFSQERESVPPFARILHQTSVSI